jgi:hypothetical protein
MSQHTLTIRHGCVEFIYADELAPLLELGAATVARASAVEPARMEDGRLGWDATILDTGVVLGPYPTRVEALDAEVAHLKATRGL